MKKDIDLQKNLFIILQGQVQRLCQLSPQKLVQHLEYVSGSDQYIPKIAELEQNYILEGVKCEQGKQKYQISKKIFIQQQKQTFQLLEHIGFRIKLLELAFLYTKKSQILHSKNLQTNTQKLQLLTQAINQINTNLQAMLSSKKTLEQQITQNQSQINQFQKHLSKIQKEINFDEVEKKKKQTELEYLLKDLQQKLKETQIVEKQKKQLTKITQNQQQLKQQSKQMQQMIEQLLQKLGQSQENIMNSSKPIVNSNQKSNKKEPFNKKIYLQFKSICKLKSESQEIRNLISSQLTKELNEKESKLHEREEKFQKVLEKYGKNGQKFTSNDDQAIKIKLRIRNFTQAIQQKQKQVSITISNLEQIKRRIKEFESTKITISNHQNIINEIKAANSAKILLPHRQITTLRQHLMIPTEINPIISAITPQLDFIMVQDSDQALTVINFLNTRKIGRMSFILKDEVFKIMNGISTDWKRAPVSEKCSRIFDLTQPIDKDSQKIWFWCIANTLLAENLDDAMKVAFYQTPRYRVITKKGEFIDISGAMCRVPIQEASENEDIHLLETRMKVLQNKIDQDSRKLLVAKKEKENLAEQLNNLSLAVQEFSNLQQLKEYLQTTEIEIASIKKSILTVQGNKANHELTVRLKQKQIQDLTKNIQFNQANSPITFDQMLELVEEYEKVSNKIKKIELSEELIKALQKKLDKCRSQIYALDQKILIHKTDIDKIIQCVKLKEKQISQIQVKKRAVRDKISEIQQKLFLLDLEINDLKGESKPENNILKQKNHLFSEKQNGSQQMKQKNNRKQQKHQSKHQNGRQPESNSQIQSLLQSKQNLPRLLSDQKTLKQKIIQQEKELKVLENLHQNHLGALSRLFSYFVKKCEQGQIQAEKQKQQFLQRSGNECLSQHSKTQSQRISDKSQKPKDGQAKDQSFQELLERKHKKFIKFKDILFEYFESQNLSLSLEKTIKKKQSSKSKTQPFLLTNLCNHCFQNKLAPLSKIISLCYFNSWKIMNIGPEDEYFFVNFLSKQEIRILTKNLFEDLSQKKAQITQSQSSEEQIKKSKSSCGSSHFSERIKKNQEQKDEQEPQLTDTLLLEHLSLERMRFLYKLYDQKMQILEKNSRSMFIKFMKSGKKQRPTNPRQDSKKVSQFISEPIDPEDPSTAKTLSFFSDPDFPLEPNELEMIAEYISQKKHFKQLQSYLNCVEANLQKIYKQLLCLRQARNSCFLNTFNLINIQVNKIYNFLTKGSAEMNLTNSINPLEGVEFSVRPFNKSWKSVNLLSGGQKTLTSLSLIFACEQVRKFPFYFMDEIDAALDYKNVTNLGRFIRDKEKVQHIVISLRKNMYEQCNSMVCIYKVNDVSRTMKVDMMALYGLDKRGGQSQKVILTKNKTFLKQKESDEKKYQRDFQESIEEKKANDLKVVENLSQTSTVTIQSK